MTAGRRAGMLALLMLTTAAGSLSPARVQAASSSNVPVTPLNPPTDQYQDPWLAADSANPAHLAVAYHAVSTIQPYGAPGNRCFIGTSTDGGLNWSNRVLVGAGGAYPLASKQTCNWTKVAFTPLGGLVYLFQTDSPTDLRVMVSPSLAAPFTAPVSVDPTQPSGAIYVDGDWGEPTLAVDPTTGSGPARIYVAWLVYASAPAAFGFVARSDDGGQTFHAPVPFTGISAPNPSAPGLPPALAVDDEGALMVAYLAQPPQGADDVSPYTIDTVRSSDHGQSFANPVVVATAPGQCLGGQNVYCDNVDGASVSIAAGPVPGQMAMAFSGPTGIPSCGGLALSVGCPSVRVFEANSADGGATWSSPQIIGIPLGNEADEQVRPQVTIAPDGRVDVAYYDFNATTGQEDTYAASAAAGAVSFSAAVRASSSVTDTSIGPPTCCADNYGGATNDYYSHFGNGQYDYLGLVSAAGGPLVAWTDSRRGTQASLHDDIYFAAAGGAGAAAASVPAPGLPQTGSIRGARSIPPRGDPGAALGALVAIGLRLVVKRRRLADPRGARRSP